MRILLTGGIKSGKSSRALVLARDFLGDKFFLATATAFDDEMALRIKKHKAERASLQFTTIEEPVYIDKALHNNMILDCIPMWLNNIFFSMKEDDWKPILDNFINNLPQNIIIVTNEIGLGLIPTDAMSRRYTIALGIINATLASHCDVVELLVAGLPLKIK